jgi:DedD protein
MDDSQRLGGDGHNSRVRRQLAWRAAAATGLILALVAALVVFERDHAPGGGADQPEQARVAKTITRMEPYPSDRGSSEPQSAAPDHLANDAVKQPPEVSEARDTALAAALPPKAVPGESVETAKPEAAPSKDARPSPAKTPPPAVEQPVPQAPPTPIDEAPPPPAAPPAPKSEAPAATGAYAVQLGVFANAANADQLRARLTQNGIASYLETRVRLGPFSTREDALAAQERLRRLGMATGVVVATRK